MRRIDQAKHAVKLTIALARRKWVDSLRLVGRLKRCWYRTHRRRLTSVDIGLAALNVQEGGIYLRREIPSMLRVKMAEDSTH